MTDKRSEALTGVGYSNWRPRHRTAQQEVNLAEQLRIKWRQLLLDTGSASGLSDTLTSIIIGDGFRPSIFYRDKNQDVSEIDKVVEDYFENPSIDFEGDFDLYGLMSLICRTVCDSGSCFALRVRTRTPPLFFEIMILEPEYLDRQKSRTNEAGNEIIEGIEFKKGKVVAYWLYDQHPMESYRFSRAKRKSKRYDVKDVAYIYDKKRPGSKGGLPWAHSVMTKLKDVDDFDHSTVKRQISASGISAVVTPPLSEQGRVSNVAGEDSSQDYENEEHEKLPTRTLEKDSYDDYVKKFAKIYPGEFLFAEPGETITPLNVPPPTGIKEFHEIADRAISKGAGLSYEAYTGDLSRVNYSSSKYGDSIMKSQTNRRRNLIKNQFLNKLWQWALDGLSLSGYPIDGLSCEWINPKDYVADDNKNIKFVKEEIRMGGSTVSNYIRSQGRNPRKVWAERQAEIESLKEANIISDANPAEVSLAGNLNNENTNVNDVKNNENGVKSLNNIKDFANIN